MLRGPICLAIILVALQCFTQMEQPDLLKATSGSPEFKKSISDAIGNCHVTGGHPDRSGPYISNLTYDSITQTQVTVFWTTDTPSDSKIKWMAPDSNYQPLIFTDSISDSTEMTEHKIQVQNLQPATIYKYNITSQNADGTSVDSGYLVTQSLSSGNIEVYFNHSVDTTVNTGEKAKGNQNFDNLLKSRINSANHSIDITLWGFEYYTDIAEALINANNRGVKIRFVYNHTANTPLIDSLLAHSIPVLKRNYDTTFSMHNKFWIFDYRYNDLSDNMYLWTGSTNVSHPQFHSDRNNVIVIQDEALCAVYTREFEEMWGSHTDMFDTTKAKFGDKKVDNVPHILNVGGIRMEVYFAPSDSVSVFLSNLILNEPTHSLFFCMLKYNLPDIENAMHSIFNDGKQIKGVFDESNSEVANSVYPQMKGIADSNNWNPPADVFIDTINGLIHHKYLIIDANSAGGNKITSTGSFNWEVPAEVGNDENSLTIFDARVNNLYFQEFSARYRESGGEPIEIENVGTPTMPSFQLRQNYPNPFNNSTTIRYTLTKPALMKLTIFDAFGRQLETLVNEKQDAGAYTLNRDASRFPSGIYYYLVTSNDFVITKKMILVK